MPRLTFLRAGLAVLAAAMFGIAVVTPRFSILPIAIGVGCLAVVATSLSHAGRLSRSLQALRSRPVAIRVWGERLPGIGDASCRIESIRAVGPGLHFFIRCGNGSSLGHLKIAQPRDARIGEGGVEISDARYVQWAGKRLRRAAEVPAVTVSVL